MRKRLALGLIAPLTVLALTACQDDDKPADGGSDETTSSPTESESSEPTETPTESPSDEATEESTEDSTAGSGELTEPGTELSIGDTATVDSEYGGKPVTVDVTVTDIEEGTSEQLEELGLKDADPQDYTPYYIKIDATLVEGEETGYEPSVDFYGFAGTTPASTLLEFGEFPPCNGEAFGVDSQVGDTVSTCAPVLVEKGSTVDAAAFGGGDDYDIYDDKQITWK